MPILRMKAAYGPARTLTFLKRSGKLAEQRTMSTTSIEAGLSEIAAGDALSDFEKAMLQELATIGLPHEGVLVDASIRRSVFSNFQNAISDLDQADRGRSLYLSKFLAAVGAGLFDAALNYLCGFDDAFFEALNRTQHTQLVDRKT